MNMMRTYEPVGMLSKLHYEMNRLFEPGSLPDLTGASGVWTPAVDIKEEENRYLIHADVPGIKPEDIEVTLERGVLTLRGKRVAESRAEQASYRRLERYRGEFARHFALPDTADEERVDARIKDGVLEVVINKKESSKPRRIAVKA
ncbi:MAG: Hsp20/alpha crystallin family protein [Nevskiales bacterium]